MNKEQLLVQPFDVGYTNLRFTASINAVIFGMPGHFTRRRLVMPRISLPNLDGTVCWWGRENDLKFTLLVPSPDDIVALSSLNDPLRLVALQIAVNIDPRVKTPDSARIGMLQRLMTEVIAPKL